VLIVSNATYLVEGGGRQLSLRSWGNLWDFKLPTVVINGTNGSLGCAPNLEPHTPHPTPHQSLMVSITELQKRPYKIGSTEHGPPAPPGETRPRRSNLVGDGPMVTTPLEGIETIHDILLYTARTFSTKEGLGWRDIEKIIEEQKEVTKTVAGREVKETKTWKYFQLSGYKYISFTDFKDKVETAACALIHLGITKGDVFNVYAATAVNWRLMAHAAAAMGGVVATAYETLGEDGLQHSLDEPECKGLFTNAPLLPTLLKVLPRTPTIKLVVYDGEPKGTVVDDIKGVRNDIQIISLDDFLKTGAENLVDLKALAPAKDDLACIMYTSGTTGPPKGVMLTHSNLVASVGAVVLHVGHHMSSNDSYLAFLPLAHILEYVVELTHLFIGVTAGYGTIRTLSDASVRNCKGDMSEFRPTLLAGVPAVWETLRKGILGKVSQSGAIRQALFNGAYVAKKYNIPVLKQLAEAVVFSKINAGTGGRLRLAMSGGAALSTETQEFMSVAVVTVLQGTKHFSSCRRAPAFFFASCAH